MIRQAASILHRGHKRSHLIFVCNFVKNQRILMQFSLLDFEMNDTCERVNFTYLT